MTSDIRKRFTYAPQQLTSRLQHTLPKHPIVRTFHPRADAHNCAPVPFTFCTNAIPRASVPQTDSKRDKTRTQPNRETDTHPCYVAPAQGIVRLHADGTQGPSHAYMQPGRPQGLIGGCMTHPHFCQHCSSAHGICEYFWICTRISGFDVMAKAFYNCPECHIQSIVLLSSADFCRRIRDHRQSTRNHRQSIRDNRQSIWHSLHIWHHVLMAHNKFRHTKINCAHAGMPYIARQIPLCTSNCLGIQRPPPTSSAHGA